MHRSLGTLVTAVIFAMMGSAALISVHFDPDAVVDAVAVTGATDVNADTSKKPQAESRQNLAQYANYYPQYPPYFKYGDGGQQQGLTDLLDTIAAQDDLHCIPKLLCEMTSSSTRNNKASKQTSFINLDSLLTLLANVDDRLASPIALFGKAIVLGYMSKQSGSCQYAYPRCPSDPNQLIYYLNNHKGGLFRLFNGRPSGGAGAATAAANSFHIYGSGDKRQYAWRFPSYNNQIHNYENDGSLRYHGKGKSLKFPSSDEGYKHEHEYDYENQHNDVLVFRDFN